jgi:hypothetical protein
MRRLGADEPPPGDAFGYAVEVPVESAAHVLGQLDRGAIEDEAALLSLAALASERARDLFGATHFAFRMEIRDDAGNAPTTVRVNLGRPALRETTEFTLRLAAADLADTLEQGAPPQRLFVEGKVDVEGDVAKAMLLGMLLAEIG